MLLSQPPQLGQPPPQPLDLGRAFESGSFAARLAPEQWWALRQLGSVRAFALGSMLMYENEPGERVMVLLDGRVKITRASLDGQETLVSIRGPGEILGELSCIDGQPRLTSVIALERAQALVLDATAFRAYLRATPSSALALLEVLSQRFRDEIVKRSQFSASDTIGRLAARLIELADRYGEPCQEGILIGLPLSQEELGAWAGACHAGVAKALQVLRELGWIETRRRRIIIRDLDALRGRAG